MSYVTRSYFRDEDPIKVERTAIETFLEEKVSRDVSGLPAELLIVLTEAFLNYRSSFEPCLSGFLAALIFTMSECGIAPALVESIDGACVDRYIEGLRGLAESLASYEKQKQERVTHTREEWNDIIVEKVRNVVRVHDKQKAKKDSALSIAA